MAKIKIKQLEKAVLEEKEAELRKALEEKKKETEKLTEKDFWDIIDTTFKEDVLPLTMFQKLRLRIMLRGKIFCPVLVLFLRINKGALFYIYNLTKNTDTITINKGIYKLSPDRVFALRKGFKGRVPLVVIKEWDILPLSASETTPDMQKKEVESFYLLEAKKSKPLMNMNRILIFLGIAALGVVAYLLYMKLTGKPPA